MEFEKYSENLTRDFAKVGKDPEQRMLARKNVEVLPNGIKTAETEVIACKTIIRYDCASDFTGTCSHFWLSSCGCMAAPRWRHRGTNFV